MNSSRVPSSFPTTAIVAALAGGVVAWLFVQNVREFYFLSDDAFISFRYANHLNQGLGLVWNPGEPIEGYTNFSWVLLMAAGLRLGWPPEILSNVLGIASGACLLVSLVLFSARLRGWSDPFIWVAPLVLATSRTYTAWCTSGLETMFFSLLVFLAMLAFYRERERDSPLPLVSAGLFSLAALTRPEGILFGFTAGLLFGIEILRGRRSLRAGLIWALPMVAIVGGHLLWRHAYYGFWVPNTFTAKVPGAWWAQGARYLALYHEDYRIGWFLPLLLPTLIWRRDFVTACFASAIGVYLLYVGYVGGDRFEFRFLVPVLPFFYWLMGDSLYQLVRRVPGAWLQRGIAYAAAAGVVAALLVLTYTGSRSPLSVYLRHGVTSVHSVSQFAIWRAAEGRLLRSLIDDGVLSSDLMIAVTGAGALPYYSDLPTIDCHGLNDLHVARLSIAARGVIAHERLAPYDYLAERGVVIIDVLNRIVHNSDLARLEQPVVDYDGHPLPLKVVRARGHYLIFATTLSDEALAQAFPGLPVQ